MNIPGKENIRLAFNHEWASFLFCSHRPEIIFLDRCQYHTLTPCEFTEEECMVELADLKRIFAPDLQITRTDDRLVFRFACYLRHIPGGKRIISGGCAFWETVETETVEMRLGEKTLITAKGEQAIPCAPYEKEGKCFVPVTALFGQGYDATIDRLALGAAPYWKKKVEERRFFCISFCEKAFRFSRLWVETEIEPLLKKNWGNVFETVWFEEGARLMPFRLYVPSTYRPDTPNKAILLFHGGTTNENVYYDDSNNKLQFYAEKYGYITIAPTSYGISTFFGSLLPILQTLDGIDPAQADPANPEGWPPFTLQLRRMANRCAWQQLHFIFEHWNIDRNNLFGQGNSAGSNALTYFAITYPGLMKAIIPGAGWVNPNFAALEKLRDTPIMHLIGSEDHHGVEYVRTIYQIVDDLQLTCEKVIVGGGTHFNAWTFVLEDMFRFYESHVS